MVEKEAIQFGFFDNGLQKELGASPHNPYWLVRGENCTCWRVAYKVHLG